MARNVLSIAIVFVIAATALGFAAQSSDEAAELVLVQPMAFSGYTFR
jgi:hypothetical protein